jgi:ribosomal protein S18 acetylase RimI-like enzyme
MKKQTHNKQSKLVIRTLTMADYDAVVKVWQLSDIHVDTKEQLRTRRKRDRDLLLVAEIDGIIVGTVIGGWDGRRASLWRMAVHPDYRRNGIGQALIHELEERVRQKGATSIFLFTGADNTIAQGLYKACGYEVGEGILSLWKQLQPPEK